MVTKKKISQHSFVKDVVQYGYFAEQFPDCFSTEKLCSELDVLLPLVSLGKNVFKSGNKYSTSPTTLSMFKNDISRRTLSVPNPESFLRLAKYMETNWDFIKRCCKSKNSLSNVDFIRSYNGESETLINCESLRDALSVSSDFMKGIKSCIRASLGYKYRMKVDISNCYNSIYTHSITWAICGKKTAKSYFLTKQPDSIKLNYEIGDHLDCLERYQKNNETNGIIVGPFTSRVFSEIILAQIDKILVEKKYVFRRYVDDYKFYFRSEANAQESLPTIEKVLNEFNLSLNTSKTEIEKYPYEIISNIKEKYENALRRDGTFGVLNAAAQLHLSGEKGAYKYALKYLRGKDLPNNAEIQLVIPTLINIMLIDPKYGRYVTKYLKKNA